MVFGEEVEVDFVAYGRFDVVWAEGETVLAHGDGVRCCVASRGERVRASVVVPCIVEESCFRMNFLWWVDGWSGPLNRGLRKGEKGRAEARMNRSGRYQT